MSVTNSAEQRIRLLHITHDLDLGGLQQVIYNICRSIDTSKFDVSILCMRSKGYFADDIEALGINVYTLEQVPHKADYFAFLKIAKFLRLHNFDVIHTHNTQPFFDGTLAAILAGVKTVIHTDHARVFPDKTRYMIAEKLMSLYAYKVVGCSEHTTQQLQKYEKISIKKLVTIPNGIDGSRFTINVDTLTKKRELGLTDSGAVIGVAVRLSDQKGITYLLQAMPSILSVHPATQLLIVGDGDLKSDLELEAKELGIAENVIFCGTRKDIPEILQIVDIYALPSKWEGLPMIILEAMASALPIVATNVGGNATAVLDGKTGTLVPPCEPKPLGDAIVALLNSETLRKEYSRNAREQFDRQFAAKIMTQKYENLYIRAAN